MNPTTPFGGNLSRLDWHLCGPIRFRHSRQSVNGGLASAYYQILL